MSKNKNKQSGTIAQRIGTLIEIEMCNRFQLKLNKRQHTFTFYDAYNKDGIYEIKAGSYDYKRFIISKANHLSLKEASGSYIFVGYTKTNKDKNLIVADEINIERTNTLSATDVNILDAKPLRMNNAGVVRINFSEVGM